MTDVKWNGIGLFVALVIGILFVMICVSDHYAPKPVWKTDAGVVSDVTLRVVSNAWSGTNGFCSVRILSRNTGKSYTITPDRWKDCLSISKGDSVFIWKKLLPSGGEDPYEGWRIRCTYP